MKNILFTTHLDDKFIDGALVMIYSMKKNVKDFMEYPMKILHSSAISDLSVENREKIKKLVPHVEFEDIYNQSYMDAPVQYPKHRVAFLSLECFRPTEYEKVFFFDCDMLCIRDISEGIEEAPSEWVSGCGGSPTDINCGLMMIGKSWLNEEVYNNMVDCVNTMGETRLFTQHMINHVVPSFNLISDDYNWKVAPTTDSDRKITEYGITDTTKIIHWAGALPDKNRKPYPKPWEEDRDSNSLTQLWYKYKDEMLEEING
jgi:lipopolysaccharide biosynthesis glycosyltransferase